MLKRMTKHTLCLTAALTVALSGSAWVGTTYAASDSKDAVSVAKDLVGKDYSAYEESPSKGFDAPGLVYYIFQTLDYKIPRSLDDQFSMKQPTITKLSSVEPGDVMFFGKKDDPQFTAIYLGNDRFIMASKEKDEVVTRTLTSSYKDRFIGAKRVLSKADQARVNIILDAEKYLGTPYLFGAKYGQTDTFDCSSFVKTVFAQNGYSLPRVSRNQANEGTYISKSNLKVGDLVFFTTKDSGGKIGHVGIYSGDGMMIHTYGEGGVKYSTIEKGWWKDHYVTARRILK